MNKQDQVTRYKYRFLARIIIETITPLAVGNGESDFMTDALVATDVNGLPYIPGTTLAGVIRHSLKPEIAKLFGFRESTSERERRIEREKKLGTKDIPLDISEGASVIFSEARLVGKDGKILDGLAPESLDWEDDFYKYFKQLPIRQHVAINDKGVAVKGAKFDEQIVYKGTRFGFEIEMVSKEDNGKIFKQILNQLSSQTLRIGGGTRHGFGEIRIISCDMAKINLTNSDDLKNYLAKKSDLSSEWERFEKIQLTENPANGWEKYSLKLKSDDFFLFGAGYADNDADIIPVEETYIDWSAGSAQFKANNIIIPASSVKGALAHRVAFHYNRLKGYYVGNPEAKVGTANQAVCALFGNDHPKALTPGKVMISDVIEPASGDFVFTKILNHVAIDRFSGGAISGALFSEKVIYGKGQEFELKIWVDKTAFSTDEKIEEAFNCTLQDIETGMLPLGGGVNRGHGIFNKNQTLWNHR